MSASDKHPLENKWTLWYNPGQQPGLAIFWKMLSSHSDQQHVTVAAACFDMNMCCRG